MSRRTFGCALAVLAIGVTLTGCPKPPHDGNGGGGAASWTTVFDDGALDRAVLSIWGTSSKNVFAVGGPLGNGGETLVLHYDGSAWTELHPGGTETFWWVNGTSATDVWMAGEQGRIAHYDGKSFTSFTSGATSTLWGIKAFSPTDVWSVGGTPEGSPTAEEDVVLHYDGSSWTRETLPGTPLHRSLFKVWGTSDSDLYVVGEAGTIWHRGAGGWVLESMPPLSKGTLFTVTGCSGNEIYAVGNQDLLKSDGTTWSKVDVSLINGGNGVACAPASSSGAHLAVVGFGGLKQRLVGSSWVDDFTSVPHGDLHAVWADELGEFWAVGGDFIAKASPGAARNGTIAHFGKSTISSTLK
jgi:hypothetical protein